MYFFIGLCCILGTFVVAQLDIYYKEKRYFVSLLLVAALGCGLAGISSDQVKSQDYAKSVIAAKYTVEPNDVELTEVLEIACGRYECYSFKAIALIWGQRVGMVEYTSDSAQFVPDDVTFTPVKPTPIPTPIAAEGDVILMVHSTGIVETEYAEAIRSFEIKNDVLLDDATKNSVKSFLESYSAYLVDDVAVTFTAKQPEYYSYFMQSTDVYDVYEANGEYIIYIRLNY